MTADTEPPQTFEPTKENFNQPRVVDEVTATAPTDESIFESDSVDEFYCTALLCIPSMSQHVQWRKRIWVVSVGIIIGLVVAGFIAGVPFDSIT